MTRHSEFHMESRAYGSGYTNYAQIVCGYCGFDEWLPAKNGGWATRVFRNHGWKVGSKPNQHRCPTCFVAAKMARRIPDNPVIPKELGKMLKTKIVTNHVRDGLLGTSVLTMHPETPAEAPQPPFLPVPPPDPEQAPAPLPEPATAYLEPKRGTPSTPGLTRFPLRQAAALSGTKATSSVDGLGFFTVEVEGGWVWKHARDTTPDEQAAWWKGRRLGPRPITRIKTSKLGKTPRLGAPIERPPTHQEAAQVATAKPGKETHMVIKAVPHVNEEPMPTDNNVVPIAARQPTRAERTLVHDELTKCYDIDAQRYGGAESDKSVAARLDVPRIWVTDVREQFFGDYDRNLQSEQRKLKIDDAIALAKAATTQLFEMAAKAEALERNLTAARKLLD